MPAAPRPPVDVYGAEVAARLRSRMARLRVSQQDVAAAVGISSSQIGRYINGQRSMTLPDFINIAVALGLDPSRFLQEVADAVADKDADAGS